MLGHFIRHQKLLLLQTTVPGAFRSFVDPVHRQCYAMTILHFQEADAPVLFAISGLRYFISHRHTLFGIGHIPHRSSRLSNARTNFGGRYMLVMITKTFHYFGGRTQLIANRRLGVIYHAGQLYGPRAIR